MPRSPRPHRTCGPPARFRQNDEVYSSRQKKSRNQKKSELVEPPALPTEAQECAKLPGSPDRNALMLSPMLPPMLSPMPSPMPSPMAPISRRLIGASAGLQAVGLPSDLCWESPGGSDATLRAGSAGSDCSLARAGSTEQLLRELFPPQK